MRTPQKVVAPPAQAAIFIVLTLRHGSEQTALDLFADVAGMTRAVDWRAPEGNLSCVVGIGAKAWDRLYEAPRPAGLHPFRQLNGSTHTAVSTPGDVLFHLRAGRMDLCFELARQLVSRLRGHADVVDEVHGFRYFDERDLLGFVDGSANPRDDAAYAAVHIGEEDPDYANGSYVVVQRYAHDLDAWNDQSVEAQEAAIGRHKLSNVEIPDEDKASDSHVALNTVTDENGVEQKILRDNMPFGTIGATVFGTYFIGYASTPTVIEKMLTNMFIGNPPGNHDRILDFSRAETGCLFFVPSADHLDTPPTAATRGAKPADGSLDIGAIKSSRRDPLE